MQETDLNRRSQGYEPCEIPLLYPAMYMFGRTISSAFTYWLLEEIHFADSNTYSELGHTFYHVLPCAFPTTKLSVSKQAECPESNRNPGSDPVSIPLTYIPHNPDSRVSKVFNVLCLNTRRFGIRQHRLYGRAPLHGLNSTVQLYAHKEVCRHALTAMVRVGNCVRFSTSRFCPNLFLLRTRTQERRSQWKKMSMSSGSNHLRIFLMNTFYHKLSKKLWYMF